MATSYHAPRDQTKCCTFSGAYQICGCVCRSHRTQQDTKIYRSTASWRGRCGLPSAPTVHHYPDQHITGVWRILNVQGLFPIKSEVEVTVTVHIVVCCTNFTLDSDSHLDFLKRNNSTGGVCGRPSSVVTRVPTEKRQSPGLLASRWG